MQHYLNSAPSNLGLKSFRNFVIYLTLSSLIIASGLCIQFILQPGMDAIWVAPYLSAAANYSFGGEFLISLKQVNEYLSLTQTEQLCYRFSSVNDPLFYNHNPIGYVLLVHISTLLFGQLMGDLQAIQFFQLCVHTIISVLIFRQLKVSRWLSLLFLILYAFNPFILYFSVFNLYYFWQVVPSAAVVLFLYNRSLFNHSVFRVILSVTFALLLLTRLTLILVVIMLIFMMLYEDLIRHREKNYLRFTLSFLPLVFLFSLLNVPDDKSVYHTIYVGAGAYSNDLGLHLGDDSGYVLMERRESITLDIRPGGNYYYPEITQAYNSILKEEVWKLIRDEPIMLIRNAALNFGQSFFLGYRPDAGDSLNILLSIVGYLILLIFLLLRNQNIWILLTAITAYSLTYVLYFPPIQSYHYGAYLLILFLFIEFIREISSHGKFSSFSILR